MLEMDFSIFPTIETERLVLREVVQNDLEALYQMRKDPEVMKYIGKTRAKTREDAQELMDRIWNDRENNDSISWAMTLKGDDTLMGAIGYYRLQKQHYRGEIGYSMFSAQWGKGLMSEAIQAVVKYGFEGLGFHSIEAITDPANERSNKILLRNGFVKEGHIRENYFFDGKFYDSAIYSLLAKEFEPKLSS